MLILFLFYKFCFSEAFEQSIKSNKIVTRLRSFAFQPNGTYHFSVFLKNNASSDKISQIFLLLLTERESEAFVHAKWTCSQNISILSTQLIPPISLENGNYATGSVFHRGIYQSYFINCAQKSLYAKYVFENQPNRLDFREQHLPYIYSFLACYFLLSSIFLIINSILHPKLNVPLHSILIFCHLLMASSYIYSARHWSYRGFFQISSDDIIIERFVFSLASLFFYVPQFLSCYGYGILRNTLSKEEIYTMFRNVIIAFIESFSCFIDTYFSAILIVFYNLSLGCAFLNITGLILIYNDICNYLIGSSISEQVSAKAKMVICFSIYFSIFLIIKGIYYFLRSIYSSSYFHVHMVILDQAFWMMLSLMDIILLSYQKSHLEISNEQASGANHQNSQLENGENFHITSLDLPSSNNEIVFITTDPNNRNIPNDSEL